MDDGSDTAKLFLDTPENDLFTFETDQLALRGNKDYCEVLKTIVMLTAQREQAIKVSVTYCLLWNMIGQFQDYNKILEIKKRTLENPWALVEKVHSGKGIDIDAPPIFQLPKVSFKWTNVNFFIFALQQLKYILTLYIKTFLNIGYLYIPAQSSYIILISKYW